jgi:hypothetical protein
MDVIDQLAPETRDVEPDALGVRDEVGEIVLVGVSIELAVHVPEFALGRRSLGSFGGLLGEAIARAARHVPVDEAQAAPKAIAHGLYGRIGSDTERALEVCVFDERDRGVVGPIHMIVIIDCWERSHGKGRLSMLR